MESNFADRLSHAAFPTYHFILSSEGYKYLSVEFQSVLLYMQPETLKLDSFLLLKKRKEKNPDIFNALHFKPFKLMSGRAKFPPTESSFDIFRYAGFLHNVQF